MALRFRNIEKKVKIKKRIIILAVIFWVSLVLFEIALNFEIKMAKTTEMLDKLPDISYLIDGKEYNDIRAYTEDIHVGKSHFSMIPIYSHEIKFKVGKSEKGLSNIKYEITSDSDKKIESGDLNYDSYTRELSFPLNEKKIENNKIYNLKIKADYDKKKLRYYAKINKINDKKMKKCLDFAEGIHKAVLAKDINNLSTMEPSKDHFSNDLSNVDIHSSMSQIMWGAMQVKEENKPKVTINEYLYDNASITYNYLVTDGKNRYRVKEYMKVKNSDNLYLLDYRRTAEQIVKETSLNETQIGINFGIIKNHNMKFISNEMGNIVSFINDGKVFQYNSTNGEIVKVFDFFKDDNKDLSDEYEIRLLGMDEGGTLSFSVYGYMGSGMHEGSSGIALYKYDSTKKETREESFVKSDMQFDFLKSEYGSTLYRSGNGNFNIMSGGTLYRINYSKNRVEKVLKGLKETQYQESANSRFISWTKKDEPSDIIYTIDLENEKVFKIKSKNKKKIKPLLYVGNDLIYGEITGEIGYDENGNKIDPMDNIVISDMTKDASSIIKEYKQDGYFVSRVDRGEGTLYVRRVIKQGDTYVNAPEDIIKNNFEDNEKKVYIKTGDDSTKGEVTRLIMNKKAVQKKKPYVSVIKMIDDKKAIMLPTPKINKRYYIVKGQNILSEYGSLSDALLSTEADRSTIINDKKIVWSSSKKDYKKIKNINQKNLIEIRDKKDKNKEYFDLNGINLTQTFYFINEGNPVYVKLDSGEYLIVGYSSIGVYVYNPSKGIYETIMQGPFNKQCKNSGNRFITYMNKN